MFDFSMSELLVVAVVALVAIGPRDLPHALRTMGRWVSKARAMTSEFHRHVDEMIREAEFEEFRLKAEELNRKSLAQILEDIVDPENEIRRSLELPKLSESTISHNRLTDSNKKDGEGVQLSSGGSTASEAGAPSEPAESPSSSLFPVLLPPTP